MKRTAVRNAIAKNHRAPVGLKKMTPAKGVDVATLDRPGSRKPLPLITLLDPMCELTRPITAEHVADWRRELADKETRPRRKELLRLWIAEYTIGELDEPMKALEIMDRLVDDMPKNSPLRGQAIANQGWFQMLCGMYAKSARTLNALMESSIGGYDKRLISGNARHAARCAGLHARNEAAGITQPPHIDPLCGANALAVALRYLKMPHDKEYVVKNTPHTGFGSTLGDLEDAAMKLGMYGAPINFPIEALPKMFELADGVPMVVRVEHDHFVAVYSADKDGVTYLCSDCGPWPGGTRTVTWKQWRLMEPDSYLAISRAGSDYAQALKLLGRTKTPRSEAYASIERDRVSEILRELDEVQTIGLSNPTTSPVV